MTRRLPANPAPGPLEGYSAQFDDLFDALAGRQAFRRYLEGLLLSTERNKTLTALAKAPNPLWGHSVSRRRDRPRVGLGIIGERLTSMPAEEQKEWIVVVFLDARA